MQSADTLEVLNKIDEILFKNVRFEMDKRGWNQSELGRRLGKDRNKISRFFKIGSWDSEMLQSLGDIFERDPSELIESGLAIETPGKMGEKEKEYADRLRLLNLISGLDKRQVRGLIPVVENLLRAPLSDPSSGSLSNKPKKV